MLSKLVISTPSRGTAYELRLPEPSADSPLRQPLASIAEAIENSSHDNKSTKNHEVIKPTTSQNRLLLALHCPS